MLKNYTNRNLNNINIYKYKYFELNNTLDLNNLTLFLENKNINKIKYFIDNCVNLNYVFFKDINDEIYGLHTDIKLIDLIIKHSKIELIYHIINKYKKEGYSIDFGSDYYNIITFLSLYIKKGSDLLIKYLFEKEKINYNYNFSNIDSNKNLFYLNHYNILYLLTEWDSKRRIINNIFNYFIDNDMFKDKYFHEGYSFEDVNILYFYLRYTFFDFKLVKKMIDKNYSLTYNDCYTKYGGFYKFNIYDVFLNKYYTRYNQLHTSKKVSKQIYKTIKYVDLNTDISLYNFIKRQSSVNYNFTCITCIQSDLNKKYYNKIESYIANIIKWNKILQIFILLIL